MSTNKNIYFILFLHKETDLIFSIRINSSTLLNLGRENKIKLTGSMRLAARKIKVTTTSTIVITNSLRCIN